MGRTGCGELSIGGDVSDIRHRTNDLIVPAESRLLSAARFQSLADVPAELEWFANISNKSTRRAYENALQDLMGFIGIRQPSGR